MKIMIIGASGYLGNTIYKKLKMCSNDDIYGTCCKSNNQNLLKIDLLNSIDINKLLTYKPDVIIMSIYDFEKEMSLALIGINEIVNRISQDTRLIYVSTTVGKGKQQVEQVSPHIRMPDEHLSKYINGKIKGESIVGKHSNHVIVRPGNIYGYDYDNQMDLRMEKLLQVSKTGETYSRTANMYASFVHVQDLADAIIELTYSDFKGIINISGERPVSHYDFNMSLANLLDIDNSFIIPDYNPNEMYHSLSNDKRKLIITALIRDI
ncbi:NAD-dependent epimerase/dehydratase family protein [Clostridium estertheticum]|uniref:NAD-dependent epimerase/dehydratase family protein n=1 Tax=Clostridium estertheticum TaxID=238834 RepID=UPI001CD134BA|nr:NAD-dependent epimerase/dehydratase family protein [Clostridium estertheticum]MBZ9687427.1 NAD-dependent epimerase/dehydratase family protein [Clostridium estertheticum]